MIDRDIRDALLEVHHRIPPRLHHFLHQMVRFTDRGTRLVHEPRLLELPAVGIAGTLGGRQRPDLQVLHAALAIFQFTLRVPGIAALVQQSVVFRPEAMT